MTTTPSVWKGLVQANTSDGGEIQSEGQVAGLPDGGYVVVWADNSHTYNSTGSAIVARRIDYAGLAVVPAGNLHGGEVKISQFNASGNQLAPAVAVLSNGNVAVAFHNNASTNDVYVRVFDFRAELRQDRHHRHRIKRDVFRRHHRAGRRRLCGLL